MEADKRSSGIESRPVELVMRSAHTKDPDDEKADYALAEHSSADANEDEEKHYNIPAETAEDLVTEVIEVCDDPRLNPWTFRTWFLGIGLAAFGSLLATIYHYKPQSVDVSVVFLAVISYVLGEAMSAFIPRKSFVGRWLNPHPFNSKEHAAIIVMSSAAANSPLATDVLATEKLYYGKEVNAAVGIFLVFASQTLGYGIAGLLRRTLVYPTKMLYPINLPMNSFLETFHSNKDKSKVRKKLRVFYIGFVILFCYEIIPSWIMPVLVGINIFCLAKRDSLLFTNLFGGSNGNEGLGIMEWSFDWNYISNPSPLWYPLQTLFNSFVGYVLCCAVFVGIYYGNIWDSKKFPFLSQSLFSAQSDGQNFVIYNQTATLNSHLEVDSSLVAQQGLPFFAGTFACYILANMLSITATFSHLICWNYHDLKSAWAFASWDNVKLMLEPGKSNWRFWQGRNTIWGGDNDKEGDPHYRLMLAYKDAPDWWYGIVLIISVAVGLLTIYLARSTLPWWAFFIACILSAVCILFFGAQYAITGYQIELQPLIQMMAGYIRPGSPKSNMYFVLFGYNSVTQGQLLLRDLKFAQYAHLSPRATFTSQMCGTIIGSIFSFIMMSTITTNQRDVLLSIEGTNTWSGQSIQSFNSQAIAWGGFAKSLFSVGGRYEWVTLSLLLGFLLPIPFWLGHRYLPSWRLDYFNTAVIASFVGLLNVGVNAVTLPWFAVGAFSQFYLRRYWPNWFIKYNYILSAAMDGGTQVLIFILSFAVFGGSGKERVFPPYWGNNFQNGNYDYCMQNPFTAADSG